ncbi:MAG: hypothetical protein ACYTFA_19395, partial [Planctomycetota bacterium]
MLSAQPAAAQLQVDNGCMEAVYQAYNGGGALNCVANDVKVAGVTNVTILDDGCQFVGDTVTFSADYEILLGAQARYDIGIYFSTDGSDAVLGSSCTIVTLPHTITDLDGTADDTNTSDVYGYCSPDGGTTLTIGGDGLPLPCNADGPPDCPVGDTCEEFGPGIQDTCGDIDDAPNPIYLYGIVITATCLDPDGDGKLDLPNATSWRQPGDNDLCLSPLGAFPGGPSKCHHEGGFDIDICVPGYCDDGNPCTDDICTIDENGDLTCTNPPKPVSTECDSDGDLCTGDHCDANGACVPHAPYDVICQDPNPPCEGGQHCEPSTGDCVDDPDAPVSTECDSDGDL